MLAAPLLLCVAMSMPAQAADGDPVRRDAQALIAEYGCSTCHSSDGSILVSGAPRIAGQKFRYLLRQLRHFRAGTVSYRGEVVAARRHVVMSDLAKQLTESQLRAIALYYASRRCRPKAAPAPAKPPGVERCEVCHGGERTNPWRDTPFLAGQDEVYLSRTIRRLWESRNRRQGDDRRYHRLAEAMFTDDDGPHLAAYAAYFARLPCASPQVPQ